jgi:hypothetical protein
LNFGSDHQVRNAFRATLLDVPSSTALLATQEVDAADVLEVNDLANAIARAEEALRARSSRILQVPESDRSLFDRLVAPTDDAVGPAVHVPASAAPLPPRTSSIPLPPGVVRPATLLRAPEPMTTPLPVPTGAPIPPAPRTEPLLATEDDAYYHPAGRIRTLADATIDGYGPEPTLLVRVRERRTALSRLVLLVLAPVVLLAIFAVAMTLGRASASAQAAKPAPQPGPIAPSSPVVKPAVVKASAAPVTMTPAMLPSPEIPVFDVRNLKNAPPPKRRR